MPLTNVTTAMTAATPITTPSSVNAERSLFAQSDCSASRMASVIFIVFTGFCTTETQRHGETRPGFFPGTGGSVRGNAVLISLAAAKEGRSGIQSSVAAGHRENSARSLYQYANSPCPATSKNPTRMEVEDSIDTTKRTSMATRKGYNRLFVNPCMPG